jgi:hypothetical protein
VESTEVVGMTTLVRMPVDMFPNISFYCRPLLRNFVLDRVVC